MNKKEGDFMAEVAALVRRLNEVYGVQVVSIKAEWEDVSMVSTPLKMLTAVQVTANKKIQ